MQNRAESAPRYSLGDLRDLLTRVNCGADLVLAVQEAMTLTGNSAADYGGALYGVYWYLTDACERLETAAGTMTAQEEGGAV